MGKYGNTRVGNFSSKLEKAVYDVLVNRELSGELRDIKTQQHVRLTRANILYIPDFSAIEVDSGRTIYVEAKGMETQSWRIKKRLWKYYGAGPLEIWMGSYAKPFLKERLEVVG